MQFDGYDNRAAALAAALVSTPPTGRAELDALLADHGQSWPLPPDGVDRLGDFVREVRDVFGAPVGAAAALVNGALTRRTVHPHVSTHNDRPPHLHYEPAGADAVERIEVNTLMGLAGVLCASRTGNRLGRCAARGCTNAFVDTSRNGRRTFCRPACANRTHVAAHRGRQRA